VPVLAVWAAPVKATEPRLTNDRIQAAEADNAFGFGLFGEMIQKEEPTANVVISPLSVATTLTMANNGAAGETGDALMRVLGIEGMDIERASRTAGELLSFLESTDDDVVFKSSQAIWVNKSFKPANRFRELNQNHFKAETAALDFSDSETLGYINVWVARETGGLVKNILDMIPPEVMMYLVNAVYFNGVWTYPFEAGGTVEAPFILSDGDTVTCSMMTSGLLKVPYFYEAKLGFHAIELPYGDSRFAMTVILPEKGRALSEICSVLNAEKWRDWTARLRTDYVMLKLPKFKLECDYLLNDALKSMGMGIAFDAGRADFSGMQENSARSLWISRVIHKTIIEVNEEGTEAGAGTVVELKKGPPVRRLTADRPFLLAVRDTSTGAILFLARVANPTQ